MPRVSIYITFLLLTLGTMGCDGIKYDATIALIGDSTVTNNEGWGGRFANSINKRIRVENFSIGGASSKSWYDSRSMKPVIAIKPDYVFIQFGHNDVAGKGIHRETDPNSSYKEYLTLYVNESIAAGAKPIILSSLAPRKFDTNGNLKHELDDYAEAARSIAQELNVVFIGLHSLTFNYFNKIGMNESMRYNLNGTDSTHLNKKGGDLISSMILDELKILDSELYTLLTK